MGQLMMTGRAVGGPKVPTLKGTEGSLSCGQCFWYLVSSLVNVSIFHSTWLDTSGQSSYMYVHICIYKCVYIYMYMSTYTYECVYVYI